MKRRLHAVCAASLLAGAAWAAAGEAPAGAFTDVSRQSGVQAIVEAHYASVPKWWLSGMTLVDFDGDGDLDLHLAGHGFPAAAGANDGKGRFTRVDPKLKIPRGKRKRDDIPYPGGEIRLVYDVNEDGKPDVLCSWHDSGGVNYLNDCKPGSPPAWNFKVHEPGFDAFSRAVAMADVNRDGLVDYLATADGRRGSLTAIPGKSPGKWGGRTSLPVLRESGAVPADVDGDGDLDYLVSQRGYNPVRRQILLNDGKGGFTNATDKAGLKEEGASIHGVGDLDADGDLDLICVEGKSISIRLNDGRGRFTQAPAIAGLAGVRPKPSTGNWGGAVVTDFDNDGAADVIVNGKYFLYLLRGLGGGRLALANKQWRIPTAIAPAVDEGLCFGDIDADGDLDLVTFGRRTGGKGKGVAVYRNDLPARRWVRVRPIGAKGNRAAAGAKIRIFEPGREGKPGKLLWFEQVAIWGRQSFHSYYFHTVTERHFGLGDREAVDVSVEFYPSGKTVWKKAVKADTVVEVREPAP